MFEKYSDASCSLYVGGYFAALLRVIKVKILFFYGW